MQKARRMQGKAWLTPRALGCNSILQQGTSHAAVPRIRAHHDQASRMCMEGGKYRFRTPQSHPLMVKIEKASNEELGCNRDKGKTPLTTNQRA